MMGDSGFDIHPLDPDKFMEEIENAITKGESSPALYEAATAILLMIHNKTDLAGIPADAWLMLADFLSGTHRRGRGEKIDKEENRQNDIARTIAFWDYLSEGMTRAVALDKLLRSEKLDNVRSIERSINRGLKYLREDAEENRRSREAREFRKLELEARLEQLGLSKTLAPFIKDKD